MASLSTHCLECSRFLTSVLMSCQSDLQEFGANALSRSTHAHAYVASFCYTYARCSQCVRTTHAISRRQSYEIDLWCPLCSCRPPRCLLRRHSDHQFCQLPPQTDLRWMLYQLPDSQDLQDSKDTPARIIALSGNCRIVSNKRHVLLPDSRVAAHAGIRTCDHFLLATPLNVDLHRLPWGYAGSYLS